MMTISNWFHMHGYAVYLWPAYGLVTFVLAGHLISSVWQMRRTRSQLRSRKEHP